MKKVWSVLLAALCLLTALSLPAFAKENYCETFRRMVNGIRFFNSTPSGQGMNAETVYDYTTYLIFAAPQEDDPTLEPDESGSAYTIPAAMFEERLFATFAVEESILAQVQALTYTVYDQETDQEVQLSVYDSATDTYKGSTRGGMGSSASYVIVGYRPAVNNRYEAFLSLVEYGEEYIPADTDVNGKDYYVAEDGAAYRIVQNVKWLLEQKDDTFRYVSWEKVAEIPTGGLTLPLPQATDMEMDKLDAQNGTTTKKPTTTTTQKVTTTTRADVKVDKELKVLAESDNVVLRAASGTFAKGTKLTIDPVVKGEAFDKLEEALADHAAKFVAYDITATLKGATVQPDGTVEATFAIPEDYKKNKVKVVYIDEDGQVEDVECTMDSMTGTVLAKLTHFSLYAVIEAGKAPVTTGVAPRSVSPWAVIGLVAGALLFVAAVTCGVLLFLYQRAAKKQAAEETPAQEEAPAEEAPAQEAPVTLEEPEEEFFPILPPIEE